MHGCSEGGQPRSLHDDADALHSMLLLLRRADLHRFRSINSGWAAGVRVVLRSEQWRRTHGDLVVARSPTQELALRSTVLMHPDDFLPGEEMVHLHIASTSTSPVFGRVVSATTSDAVERGTLALNVLHRKAVGVTCGQLTPCPLLVPPSRAPRLASAIVEVRMQVETSKGATRFSRPIVKRAIRAAFGGQALWPTLELALPVVGRALPWHALPDRLERAVLLMVVHRVDWPRRVTGIRGEEPKWGVLSEDTELDVREPMQRSFLELVDTEEGFGLPSKGNKRTPWDSLIGGGCCG